MKTDQTSAAIILVNGGRALMQLRDNIPEIVNPGHWCIPGGMVKSNESPKEAAQRELKEETNYVSSRPKLLTTETYQLPDGRIVERHIFFEIYDGKQRIECLEGQKMEFKSAAEIGKLKVYPDHEKLVRKAIRLVQSG